MEKKEIIGLIGVIGSGKDYKAKQLLKQGYIHLKHASALRKITEICFSLDLSSAETYEKFKLNIIPEFFGNELIKNLRSAIEIETGFQDLELIIKLTENIFNINLSNNILLFEEFIEKNHKINMTGRQFLQQLGNKARDVFKDTIWIDVLYRKIEKYNKVVISDVRYPNEVKALFEHKGKLILCNYTKSEKYNPNDNHISEKLSQDILKLGFTEDGFIIKESDIKSLL